MNENAFGTELAAYRGIAMFMCIFSTIVDAAVAVYMLGPCFDIRKNETSIIILSIDANE